MQPKEYLLQLVERINNYPDKEGHRDIYIQHISEFNCVAGAFMRCGIITTHEQLEFHKMIKH
jgi:hypothetical protein